MDHAQKKRLLNKLCEEIGVERLLAVLPQQEVKKALRLVSVGELASDLGMNYGSFHSKMVRAVFPYPEVPLRRRAYFSPEQAQAITEMVKKDRKSKKLTYKAKSR